jgi:hypothetical protein
MFNKTPVILTCISTFLCKSPTNDLIIQLHGISLKKTKDLKIAYQHGEFFQ